MVLPKMPHSPMMQVGWSFAEERVLVVCGTGNLEVCRRFGQVLGFENGALVKDLSRRCLCRRGGRWDWSRGRVEIDESQIDLPTRCQSSYSTSGETTQ